MAVASVNFNRKAYAEMLDWKNRLARSSALA